MARCAIYARVSTADQSAETQLNDLQQFARDRGFELVGEYVDGGVSGAKKDRPELGRLMADARARRFDTVLVWKFDRFSRSLIHLVNTLEEFGAIGIDFISMKDQMDTTTPQGKLLFQINAAFAEFEREMIRERVKAGMRTAKAKGKHCGRPQMEQGKRAAAQQLRGNGLGYREIAKTVGISTGSAVKYAKHITSYETP